MTPGKLLKCPARCGPSCDIGMGDSARALWFAKTPSGAKLAAVTLLRRRFGECDCGRQAVSIHTDTTGAVFAHHKGKPCPNCSTSRAHSTNSAPSTLGAVALLCHSPAPWCGY